MYGGTRGHGASGSRGHEGHSPSRERKGSGAGNGSPISPSCSGPIGGACLHGTLETGTKGNTSDLGLRAGDIGAHM